VAGVDLGGTTYTVALLNARRKVLRSGEFPTDAGAGAEALLERIAASVRNLSGGERVAAVGVGLPGLLDTRRGVALHCPNLPGWKEVPVVRILRRSLGVPVVIDNDVNAATRAELHLGAGRGVKDFICLTLGTGIGGGIVVDGRIVKGATGSAGEIGHMVMDPSGPDCPCGRRGCLELYASGRAIALRMRELIEAGAESSVRELAGDKLDRITAQHVFDAAARGDGVALKVIDSAMEMLGRGLSIMVMALNPRRILIGGGVARSADLIFPRVKETIDRHAWEPLARAVNVMPMTLGPRAGAIGAGLLALAHLRGER
jgi:glucokinase